MCYNLNIKQWDGAGNRSVLLLEAVMTFDELLTFVLSPAAQIALIIGLAELGKRSGIPTRWIPLLDLVLGVISGIIVYALMEDHTVMQGIMVGIAMGLSACGLFSGVKNVANGNGE